MKDRATWAEVKNAERAIKRSAVEQGLPVSVVREGIKREIAEAMANPDPKIRAQWAKTPFKDAAPSPEEFVAWCARETYKLRSN